MAGATTSEWRAAVSTSPSKKLSRAIERIDIEFKNAGNAHVFPAFCFVPLAEKQWRRPPTMGAFFVDHMRRNRLDERRVHEKGRFDSVPDCCFRGSLLRRAGAIFGQGKGSHSAQSAAMRVVSSR